MTERELLAVVQRARRALRNRATSPNHEALVELLLDCLETALTEPDSE